MDVLQLLDDELKNKSDWSLEEKARYLYIRSCELFSYDARYQCDLFWKTFGEKKVRKEIVNKKIDLRNVSDFKVVCSSYSRYVYKTLLEELLNTFVFINKGITQQGRIHFANSFKIGKDKYYADATGKADIERVKLGLATNAYYKKMCLRFINNIKLKEIDKKIDYIEKEYFKSKLMRKIYNLENIFFKTTGQWCEDDEIGYFLFLMNEVKKNFSRATEFKEYTDAFFCIEYLLDHFFSEDININLDNSCFINHNLVDISKEQWKFINVLEIDFKGEKFSFLLEPVNGKYEFYEIPISEGDYYKKELRHYKKRI